MPLHLSLLFRHCCLLAPSERDGDGAKTSYKEVVDPLESWGCYRSVYLLINARFLPGWAACHPHRVPAWCNGPAEKAR